MADHAGLSVAVVAQVQGFAKHMEYVVTEHLYPECVVLRVMMRSFLLLLCV